MSKSANLLASVAIATLIGATAVTTVANGASAPSSPEEQAATAELNRKLLAENAAKDAQAKAQYEEQIKQQKIQYEEQMRAWEKKQADYQAQLNAAKGTP